MKDLIEHRPNTKMTIKIGDDLYKPDSKGSNWLPYRFKQFNPVEEIVIKPKKKKKVKED